MNNREPNDSQTIATMPHIFLKNGSKFVRSVVRNRVNYFEKRHFERNMFTVLCSFFSGKFHAKPNVILLQFYL